MKILYYCPEYYYRHGGSTHARGFFDALGKLSSVSGSFLYPKGGSGNTSQNARTDKSASENLGFLPPTTRKIVRFFTPRRDLTAKLINEIKSHECDAIVIRTGARQPIIKKIKKACPDTTICLEINSIYFDESLPGLPLRWLFQRWEIKRYSQADAIVVVSSYLKTFLVEHGINSAKILVNQNGVEAGAVESAGSNDVKEKHAIPKDAFVIGYIGGMEPFRRLPEVIAYIAKLRQAGNDDIYFLVVGDGADMPAVQAAIEVDRDVLQGTVKLAGWQEHSAIPGFLGIFDLAIFPFTNDYCSPLKLFEYLAAGVPTIGPDTPAVREVFEDGVHLKMVKQDGSDFVDTVLELKGNPGLAMALGDKGRLLVLSEYTWKKNAERVVGHIQSLRKPKSDQ